ncbi:MAG: TerB family tellurite resistance protein [Pseudomonadota bacterium]|nr:TerB family tellurite resistance protein [Pseudomonadota bacterium]
MLDRFKAFFEDKGAVAEAADGVHTPDEFHLAAAALLVHAATVDAEFASVERSRIEWLCETRFDLGQDEAHELILAAQRETEESVQLLRFTRTIKDGFSYEERVHLMEMLWEVVYADEQVEAHEAMLMRRIAGLIYVDDRDSGTAKQRVRARLEKNESADLIDR